MRTTVLALLLFPFLCAAGDRVTTEPPRFEGDMSAEEGPSWDPAGYLYFVGRSRIYRVRPGGKPQVFRDPVGGPNGSLVLPDGRLVVAEAGARRVTRFEREGGVTVLADRYEGARFNSPNDLALDSRGRIYFTDPRYGPRESMEMAAEGVYRIDAPGKVTRILAAPAIERPNGILVAPGDRYLYLADNNNNTVGGARKLWRFDLKPDGTVDPETRKLIFDWRSGRGPDGLKMDTNGRLYVAAGLNRAHLPFETADEFKGGIYVLSPAGELLQFVPIPRDEVTNCAFGGRDRKTLYITAGGALWSVRVKTPGIVSAIAQQP